MADDGIHEIQLNGKQLVFLFMAVTVGVVVIFLCGVMVGRGVRTPGDLRADVLTSDPAIDPTAPAIELPDTSSTAGIPAPAAETLTYATRLEASTPPPEVLREPVDPPPVAAEPIPDTEPEERESAAEGTRADAPPVPGEPPGSGFVVQVAAVRARPEADTIARRLIAKGYPSFVTSSGTGAPRVFRVRVGKYPSRREAETVANRLEKEEQFKPWITR